MKNKIINGSMVIDQRNAGASVTPTSGAYTYIVDRFKAFASQASKFTIQQNAGSVTPPVGFTNYLGATSSSAYSINSTDEFLIAQIIEGFNVADLGWGSANAKTVTLSFWAYSSLTGTFGGALRNSANTRSYPFSYSIPVANTWTQISITIAGDTTGTWLTTNGAGIQIFWGLGVGSTYSGTAGSWAGTAYDSATGATSVVGTNGATFYITGVQLEVGSSATGFEYNNYQTQLANCQRYFCSSFNIGTAPAQNAGLLGSIYFGQPAAASTAQTVTGVRFPVVMRDNPSTVTIYNPSAANAQIRAVSGSDWSATTIASATGQNGFGIFGTSPAVGAGAAAAYHYSASAEL
jgi:hypothetical protein